LVVEKRLGRYLRSDEHVHHINGDKTDNRDENLIVMSHREHFMKHRPDYEEQRVTKLYEAINRKWGTNHGSTDTRHSSQVGPGQAVE